MSSLSRLLDQVDTSANRLDKKVVETQLDKRLLLLTLELPNGSNRQRLRSLDTKCLTKDDPLVNCRTEGLRKVLSTRKLSIRELKKSKEQAKLLHESVTGLVDVSVNPTVLSDEEMRLDSREEFGDIAMQSRAPATQTGFVLAVHTRGGVSNAFVYSSAISHSQSGEITTKCDLAEAYRTPDESLAFPLHPGDEIEFTLTNTSDQRSISDIRVVSYNKLKDEEIVAYVEKLQNLSDPVEALLMITNFPPMWKYITNVSQLPEGIQQKIIVLHNRIWQSRKSDLQTSRVKRLMQSYVGAKFLDNLYDQIDTEKVAPDTNVTEFFTGLIKYLPTSAFAVVRHIRRLTQVLNRNGQMTDSYNFLMDVVTATCVPPKAARASALSWDQTPLIVTPSELRVLTQAGSLSYAELPVVQTKGPYRDLTDYYNTYFRLLREDCFGEVCSVIRKAKLGDLDADRNVVYRLCGFTGLHFLRNGRGMAYGLKFESSSTVDWTTSDALKGENLVCISMEGSFEDERMVWATIATQRGSKMDKLIEGELFVQFCTEANERTDAEVITLLLESQNAVMVESPTFFRAYYPVLKALQRRKIEETPFQEELVRFDCSSGVDYIEIGTRLDWKVVFKLKSPERPGAPNQMPYKTFGELDALASDPEFECDMDESQLDALKLAFTHRLAIIQGPPGTGKSYIGSKLVHLLMSMDARPKGPILILTYKNRVLDQFLVDCLQFCGADRIVRVGRVGDSRLEGRGLSVILHREKLPGRRTARRIHYDCISRLKELKAKLHRAGRQLKMSDSLSVDVIISQATNEQLRSLVPSTDAPSFTEEDSRTAIASKLKKTRDWRSLRYCKDFQHCVAQAAIKWISKDMENQGRAQPAATATVSSLFRSSSRQSSKQQSEESHLEAFQVKTVEQERAWSAHGEDEVNVYGRKMVDEGAEAVSFVNESKRQEHRFNVSRQELPPDLLCSDSMRRVTTCSDVWSLEENDRRLLVQVWMRDYYNVALNAFTDASTEYNAICDEIQDRNNSIYYETLKAATIVGMTTTGAAIHQQLLVAVEPSVVIVEEACEVLEAQLLATLTPSVKHLIMIGDHVQLRPRVACHRLAVHHYFDVSMFERLVSNEFPHRTLRKQRRMREEFTELLKPYYPALQSHSQVRQNRIPSCLPQKYFFFWSYSKNYETKQSGSGLIVNKYEVEMVTKLVLALLYCGEDRGQVSVLSPYRAQVHAITKRLQNCKDLISDLDVITNALRVKVCTVDEYQGDENDIIVLSLVRSNSGNVLGFLKEKNRLVVSVSRQRSSLIVIGNSGFLEKNDSSWKRVIETFKRRKCLGTNLTVKINDSELPVEGFPWKTAAGSQLTVASGTKSTGESSAAAIGTPGPISTSLSDRDEKGGQAATQQPFPYLPPSQSIAVDSKSDIPDRLTLLTRDSTGSQEPELVLQSPSSPSTPLTPAGAISRKLLLRAARDLVQTWKSVCRELGVEDSDIVAVSNDHKDDVQEQAYQGLQKWCQLKGARANICDLVRACNEVGRSDVAGRLLKDTDSKETNMT